MLNAIQAFLNRPGVQASEFKILAAVTTWLGVNASQHVVTLEQGLAIAAPGIVYAIARGLAKSEVRNQASVPPSPRA